MKRADTSEIDFGGAAACVSSSGNPQGGDMAEIKFENDSFEVLGTHIFTTTIGGDLDNLPFAVGDVLISESGVEYEIRQAAWVGNRFWSTDRRSVSVSVDEDAKAGTYTLRRQGEPT